VTIKNELIKKENYKLENFYNDGKFVAFFYELGKYYIDQLSPSDILSFYEINDTTSLFETFNNYLNLRINYGDLENLSFPNLDFNDYYAVLYYLNEKYGYQIIEFNNDIINLVNRYSSSFDILQLENLNNLKLNILKINKTDEQQFINCAYILKEYYDLYEEIPTKEKKTIKTIDDHHITHIDKLIKYEKLNPKYDVLPETTKLIIKSLFNRVLLGETNTRLLYEFFTITVYFFEYNKEILTFEKLKKYIPNSFLSVIQPLTKDDLLKLDTKYEKIWKFYYNLNNKIIVKNKKNKTDFHQLFENFDYFLEKWFNELSSIEIYNYLLKNVPTEDLFIIRMIKDEDLRLIFLEKQISTLKDLLNMNLLEYKFIMADEIYLKEIRNICKLIDGDLKYHVFNLLRSYVLGRFHNQTRDTIIYRSKGKTLQEIGDRVGLTRERIRQLENKALIKYRKELHPHLINLLRLYSKSGLYLTKDFLMNIFRDYFEIFIYLNESDFDNELNLFWLHNIEKINKEAEKTINDKIIFKYLNKEEFDYLVEEIHDELSFNLPKTIIKQYLIDKYEVKGKYIFFERPNLTLLYEIILRHHFDEYDGLTIDNTPKFKDVFFEVFDDETIYEKSDRTVFYRATDNKNIVLIDRGTYNTKYDMNFISKQRLEPIYYYIKKRNSVFIEALYNIFEKELKPEITSKYLLHGALRYYYSDLYFTKDVVGTFPNPYVDVKSIIENYALQNNGLLNLDNFIEDVPEVAGIHYEYQIGIHEKLIGMFYRNFIHVNYLKYYPNEMEKTKNEVLNILSITNHIDSGRLLSIMYKKARKSLIENKIDNAHYAYNYFKNYFKKDFCFEQNLLTLIGRLIIKIDYDEIINFFITKNIFRIEEIKQYYSKNNLRLYNIKEILETLYKHGYIRVDEDVIMKRNLVINEMSIKLFKNIETRVLFYLSTMNSINLDNIDYSLFPKIKIEWNKHLLAHMLKEISNKITVETIGSQYNNLQYILTLKGEYNDE